MVNIKKTIVGIILIIVFILIVLQVLADTAVDFNTASGNLTARHNGTECTSDSCGGDVFPLPALVKPGGIVYLILIVSVFITIMVMILKGMKQK